MPSQPEKTEILSHSVVKVAESNGGHLVEQTNQVAKLFKKSFGLFSICHNTYNAKYATDTDIAQLGELPICTLQDIHNIYIYTHCILNFSTETNI